MRKGLRNGAGASALAPFLFCFLLAACAGKPAAPAPAPAGPKAAHIPSPEADPQAPGMIPIECEQLLNRSRDWGFEPEKAWRPATVAQARGAADFFADFHLVPESTSNFARAWMASPPPKSAAAAKRSLERMDRAQSCDILLAHKLVLALLRFRWPKRDRAAVGRDFLLFVRNQQDRVAPTLARAVQIDVLRKAARKGYFRADLAAIESLRKWFDDRTVNGLNRAEETAEDPLAQWKLNREELEVSEEARERLGKVLPLAGGPGW